MIRRAIAWLAGESPGQVMRLDALARRLSLARLYRRWARFGEPLPVVLPAEAHVWDADAERQAEALWHARERAAEARREEGL